MKDTLRIIFMVAALLAVGNVPALADANETLEKFRASFEKRMNTELDEHGENARKLRQQYLEALKRVKVELGREEKLAAAVQVLEEIEAIEDGEEAKPLPENADYRLMATRKKWEAGLDKILEERRRKIETTATLYFKALDEEKRRLTRAGKIKDALLFEEEEQRVRGLPEVKAALDALAQGSGGAEQHDLEGAKIGKGDLALAARGAKASGANTPADLIDGDSETQLRSNLSWGKIPCVMDVQLADLFQVSRIRLRLWDADSRKYRYKLLVSKDGKEWDTIVDHSKKGQQGWQEFEFATRAVRYVRVVGLGNTANDKFHVVELEVFSPSR